eukprot:m.242248 g.242248  ORF g.242248 m.242248 type:complete len:190 (-) comp54438_c0_seq2:660-1229(-)
MAKATTIKDAIMKWEEKNQMAVAQAPVVKLICSLPPIEKMDAALSQLSHVEQLSLSTNAIEKISNLNGFKNLKVLSLGRNNIKAIAGLEPVADTLEQLWISYNLIDKLKGIGILRNLKVLYMSNNKVKDWSEFERLKELPNLEDLLFVGNPLQEKHAADGDWIQQVASRLPKLKKLDGVPIVRQDEDAS